MSDIVERLRSVYAAGPLIGTFLYPVPDPLCSEAADEIERLRAYKEEIEHWTDIGERMIGPAAEWGPGGNVMVQSSVMFKLGAWWADRPWRARKAQEKRDGNLY